MFFDEFVEPFFEELGDEFRTTYVPGQLFETYVFYTYENLEIWRPTKYDGTQTCATEFQIVTAGGDAFRRPQPLHSPKLEAYEEFPVITAKRRPVVLIVPDPERSG